MKIAPKQKWAIFLSFALALSTLSALTAVQIALPQKAEAATVVDMAGQNLQLRANLAHCIAVCTSGSETTSAISAISYSSGTITYTATSAVVTALAAYQGIVIKGTASQMSACPEAFGPKQIAAKASTTFTVSQTVSGSCTTTAATASYYAAVNGSANGSKVLYEYVGLVNGIAIDAVVTTTLDSNVSTTYDPATLTNANSETGTTNDGYFYQSLGGTGGVAGNGASFRFDFYLHGSTSVSAGVVSGTALTLQNISVTSIDLDNGNQYTDFSGFQGYKLSRSDASITRIDSRTAITGTITAETTTGSNNNSRVFQFAVPNSFAVGDTVTVSGASVTGFNKSYVVASATSTSFTTTTGQGTSPGTWSGTATATRAAAVIYTGTNTFAVGDTVTISLATTAGYNGTFAVTASTGSTFTVASTASGPTSTASATATNSHLSWTTSPTSPQLLSTNPKTVRFQSCPGCGAPSNIDQDAVETVYTSVTSVTVKIGQSDTGNLIGAYGVLFGPRLWVGAASKTYTNTFNSKPTSANTSTTVPANTNTLLTLANLGASGFSDADANPFSGVKITALPTSGTLEWYNGTGWVTVTVGQAITASDIDNGFVRFNGGVNTTLQFTVFDGLDYSTSSYTLTLTVSGEAQTISVVDPGGKHSGDTTTISATVTSGLQVVATSSTPSICTVSANLTIAFLSNGNCQLTFNQSGGTTGGHTYSPAPAVTLTIVVSNLAIQNISFPNPGDTVVATFPLTIPSNAVSKNESNTATGLSVNLATFTSAVCKINANGTSIDILKLGSCSITASQGGGTSSGVTYAAASNVSQAFLITNPLPRPNAPTGSGASSSSITVTFTANGSAAKSICKVYNAAGAIVQTIDPCTSVQTITGLTSGGAFKVSITSVGDGTTNTDSPEGTLSAAISTLSPSLSPSPQTVSGTKGTAITSTTAYTPTNFTTTPTYTIAGGTLPTGLSFNASTGVLSGTPSSTISATTFTVTGGNGTETATASISVTVVSPTLTVSYDSNGGSAMSPSSVSWTSGTSLALPAGPTKLGYNFAGWFDASSGGNLVGSGLTTVTPSNNSNFTLYAQWTAISNTISYRNGGAGSGTAPVSPTSVNSGSTFVVPSNSYVYAGHTFAGWSDGSSTYLAGATYPASGTINSAITLTAQWTLDSVTVSFNPNTAAGGSGTMASQTLYYDSSTVLNVVDASFSNSGKNFIGWNTNASATTALYSDQGAITLRTGTTLYAIWSAFLPWVIHPSNKSYLLGGTVPNLISGIQITPTAGLAAGETVTCGVFALSDTTFATPLTIDANLAIGTYNIFCSGTPAAGYGAATVDLGTLTVDSPNRSITYLGNLNSGGSAPSATVVSTGTSATVSGKGSLVRTSFGFTGWNTAADGSGTAYLAGDTPTLSNNLTLYAQWEQDSYHGIAKNDLITLGTSTTAAGISIDTTWTNGGSSIRAQIPADAFPTNTTLRYYLVNTLSYANSLIGSSSNYVLDMLLSWLASDYTVPDAVLSKPIRVTITNSSILANADMYVIIGGTPTLLSTDATTLSSRGARIVSVTNGQAILEVIRDPQLVVKNLTYSVTYADTFKTTGSVPTDSNAYLGNASATVLGNTGTLARTGYQFGGWCDVTVALGASCSGHTYQNGNTLTFADANITLRAIWTANTLTISYDGNGGNMPSGGASSTTTGATISSLATTSQAGYTFNGWFDDRTTGTQITTSAPHGKTSNFTLYAQWTINGSSSIIFNNNGGSGTMATQTDNTTRAISLNTYTRDGFTFREWNTASNGSGTTYQDGDNYDFGVGVTLYAMWTGNALTITYDENGGSSPVGGDTSTVSGGTLSSLPTSSLSGFTLDGWYTDSSTGTFVTTSTPHGQITNFTLYAHWSVPNAGGGGGGGGGGGVAPEPKKEEPAEKKETTELPIFITPKRVETPTKINQPSVTTPVNIPSAPISKPITPAEIGEPEVIAFPSERLTIREITVYPSVVANGIQISGVDWSVSISSTTRLIVANTTSAVNRIGIEAGNNVTAFGTGFKPNTQVDVFVYSSPLWLGSTITDSKGNYAVTLPMPKALAAGEHIFQSIGVTNDNVARTANVPITLLPVTTKTASKQLNVYFGLDTFFLNDAGKAQLTALYKSVKARLTPKSQVSVNIVGWVQPTIISPNVNYLSTGRATVVMKFLKSLGLKASYTLNTPGHDKPNVPAARRAEVTVVWTNPKS